MSTGRAHNHGMSKSCDEECPDYVRRHLDTGEGAPLDTSGAEKVTPTCRKLHPENDLACGKPEHKSDKHACYVEGEWVHWVGHQHEGTTAPRYDSQQSQAEFDEAREGNLGEVIDGRVSVYGEVIPAFTRQAQAISAVLNHEVQPWEVPLIMIAIKMIRTTEAPDYSDNSDDIEGYLGIFRQLIGEDMIEARSVKEYVAKRMER